MRKVFLALLGGLFIAGCSEHHSATAPTTTPNNTPPDTSHVTITLTLAQAVNRGVNRYSGRLEDVSGSNGMIRDLPVASGPNTSRGEGWSGSWVEVVDFANNPGGIGDETANPFIPGVKDFFEFNDMPPVRLVPNPVSRVEFGMRVIWGGQIDPDTHKAKWTPFDKAAIVPTSKNMQIKTQNGMVCTFASSPDALGMIHVLCPGMPY